MSPPARQAMRSAKGEMEILNFGQTGRLEIFSSEAGACAGRRVPDRFAVDVFADVVGC